MLGLWNDAVQLFTYTLSTTRRYLSPSAIDDRLLADRMPSLARTIAIIGAGPSGIAAAKYLQAEQYFTKIDVFEQRSQSGGIWNTDASSPGCDVARFPSPIYEGLESNIPSPEMQFHDKDFPKDCELLPTALAVRNYLHEYSAPFLSLVRFRTMVDSVEAAHHDINKQEEQNPVEAKRWKVTYTNLKDNSTESQIYDAVIVASGRYVKPYTPDISGLEEWIRQHPGTILHSGAYRNRERFSGKRVLLVGYSSSGVDLAPHLESVCKKPLYISTSKAAKRDDFTQLDPSTIMVPAIQSLHPAERTALLSDGSKVENIDQIVFATGFRYDHHFLNNIHPGRPTNVETLNLETYMHTFWIHQPTLAFVLLPFKVTAFPFAESQSALIARIFSGRLTLPSKAEMESWIQNETKKRGTDRSYHTIGFPDEADISNQIFDMCKEAENPKEGKMPPYWDAYIRWLHENSKKIKAATEARGKDRFKVKKPEDVGFHFDKPTK